MSADCPGGTAWTHVNSDVLFQGVSFLKLKRRFFLVTFNLAGECRPRRWSLAGLQRGPDFPQTWSKMHRTNLKIILQSHLRYLRTLYPGSRFASRIPLDTIGFSCRHLRRVRGSERWKLVGLFSVFLWFYCTYSKWIFVLSSELNEFFANN